MYLSFYPHIILLILALFVNLGYFFINWESKQTKKYAKEALKNLSHKFLKR